MTASHRSTSIDDPTSSHDCADARASGAGAGVTTDRVDATRRRLLGGAASASLLGALPVHGIAAGNEPLNVRFTHGVASGDPLADRVILWTRVIPQGSGDVDAEPGPPKRPQPEVPVQWQVAEDVNFSRVVASGEERAVRSDDYCVKVDAQGLKPATRYWYRFTSGSAASPVGQTKTLPVGDVKQVRFAVFSCANYAAGYFNVYAEAVRRMDEDPGRYDALLHLGDYIYESSADGYASGDAKALGRVVDPPHEAVNLVDYRRRYAQCRGDEHLQRLHALAPMIAVWDDHEFANDAWIGGAENHQDVEGTFKKRRNAAARAWREWLPVRDKAPLQDKAQRLVCYRGFEFGNLLSLNMLDTRLRRRMKKLALKDFFRATAFDEEAFRNTVNHQERDLLGTAQWVWLSERMKESRATWQVLGQQVLMARMAVPLPLMMEWVKPGSGLTPSAYAALVDKEGTQPSSLTSDEKQMLALLKLPPVPYNLDAWDGYPDSRHRLLDNVLRHGKNLVVLAGDTHNAWASDLKDRQERHMGVEFATPSVSSPGLEVTLAKENPTQVAELFQKSVKTLRFAETSRRGYMEVTATPESCRADWILISTVKEKVYTAEVVETMHVLPGKSNRKLIRGAPAA